MNVTSESGRLNVNRDDNTSDLSSCSHAENDGVLSSVDSVVEDMLNDYSSKNKTFLEKDEINVILSDDYIFGINQIRACLRRSILGPNTLIISGMRNAIKEVVEYLKTVKYALKPFDVNHKCFVDLKKAENEYAVFCLGKLKKRKRRVTPQSDSDSDNCNSTNSQPEKSNQKNTLSSRTPNGIRDLRQCEKDDEHDSFPSTNISFSKNPFRSSKDRASCVNEVLVEDDSVEILKEIKASSTSNIKKSYNARRIARMRSSDYEEEECMPNDVHMPPKKKRSYVETIYTGEAQSNNQQHKNNDSSVDSSSHCDDTLKSSPSLYLSRRTSEVFDTLRRITDFSVEMYKDIVQLKHQLDSVAALYQSQRPI